MLFFRSKEVLPPQQKILTINSRQIVYTLKRSKRSKTLRMTVYADSSFVVTVPQRIDVTYVERYLVQKADWIISKIDTFKNPLHRSLGVSGRKDYLVHKDRARNIVHERLQHFNTVYEYSWNRVAIKNTKSRWGSCSKKKNLNFSYKLALLPSHLVDYIVVHELCHLEEMNHSENFWQLVEKAIPDYRQCRQELKHIV